jgi:hypothetical protein
MARRIHSKWMTTREVRIYVIDFSGLETDRAGLKIEMDAIEAAIKNKAADSVLATVDLHQVAMSDELINFFKAHCSTPSNPFHRMAVMGLSPLQRWWYRVTRELVWPKNVVFLDDYETAKRWLVSEENQATGGWRIS